MLDVTQRRMLLACVFGLTACASAPVPQLELDRAKSAIAAAERARAAELAPVDYRIAGEDLNRGRLLIAEREHTQAKRRLELAAARAELAASKAQGARLRGEVQAKEAENAKLRRELLGEEAR